MTLVDPGVCARSGISAVGRDGGGRVSRLGERALATPAPVLRGFSGACAASVASPPHPAFPARLAPRAHARTWLILPVAYAYLND